jgi:hypothetical protein
LDLLLLAGHYLRQMLAPPLLSKIDSKIYYTLFLPIIKKYKEKQATLNSDKSTN